MAFNEWPGDAGLPDAPAGKDRVMSLLGIILIVAVVLLLVMASGYAR